MLNELQTTLDVEIESRLLVKSTSVRNTMLNSAQNMADPQVLHRERAKSATVSIDHLEPNSSMGNRLPASLDGTRANAANGTATSIGSTQLSVSESGLIRDLRNKAKSERRLSLEVIDLIKGVLKKKLYLKLGFSSLYEFVTQDLGYEPASANRRIQAAYLIASIPETREKIHSGTITLSVASQIQSFSRKEKLSVETKRELVTALENKSSREAEKIIVTKFPEAIKHKEKAREISAEYTELKIVLDQKLKSDPDDLLFSLSHQNPNLSYVELIRILVKKEKTRLGKLRNLDLSPATAMTKARMKVEPKVQSKVKAMAKTQAKVSAVFDIKGFHSDVGGQAVRNKSIKLQENCKANESSNPQELKGPVGLALRQQSESITDVLTLKGPSRSNANKRSGYVESIDVSEAIDPVMRMTRSRAVKVKIARQVCLRDGNQCTHVDPVTKRRCHSRYMLELDHIVRFRHGGEQTLENLRLLCRAHNQWRG